MLVRVTWSSAGAGAGDVVRVRVLVRVSPSEPRLLGSRAWRGSTVRRRPSISQSLPFTAACTQETRGGHEGGEGGQVAAAVLFQNRIPTLISRP